MQATEILLEIIAASIGAALLAAISAVIHRARKKPVEGMPDIMTPPPVLLVIGMVGTALFLAPALFVLFFSNEPRWISLPFLALALPGLLSVASALRTRCLVQPYGLQVRTLFKRDTWIAWGDIERVQWAPVRQGFVLRTKTSGSFLIDLTLRGLPNFARHLQNGVPSERIDASARTPLAQAVAGTPPELNVG